MSGEVSPRRIALATLQLLAGYYVAATMLLLVDAIASLVGELLVDAAIYAIGGVVAWGLISVIAGILLAQYLVWRYSHWRALEEVEGLEGVRP